jgi:hypothetical protein
MKTLGVFVLGWFAIATPSAGADGLAGLDAQLNGTGRIGVMTPRLQTQVAAGPSGDVARGEMPIAARNDDLSVLPAQTEALGEAELKQTEVRVGACRVEVARRRQVPPSKVAAGTVRLRFVVEPNGRVHDAEAVSAAGTDHEVAACAKRILSDWAFGKHSGTAVLVERNYQLGDRSPAAVSERP